MTRTVPAWMLGLTAGQMANDTHQQDGAHLRILPSPVVGLPMTPFAVSTAELRMSDKDMLRQGWEIRWMDADKQPLTTPIDVTPGRPVYGYLSQRGVYVTLQMDAGAGSDPGPGSGQPTLPDLDIGFDRPPVVLDPPDRPVIPRPDLPGIVFPRPGGLLGGTALGGFGRRGGRFGTRPPEVTLGDLTAPGTITGSLTGSFSGSFSGTFTPDGLLPDSLLPGTVFVKKGLRLSIYGDGVDPDTELAATRQAPWDLAGQAITRLKVEGTGRIHRGAFVPEALLSGEIEIDQGVFRWRDSDYWSLPIDPQPHYGPTDNAPDEGRQRAEALAGPRKPMQEAPAATPATAPARPQAEGLERAETGLGLIMDDLKTLLDAGSTAQPLRQRSVQFEDHGSGRGPQANAGQTFALPSLPLALQAALDPDLGHMMGFFGQVPRSGAILLIRVRCALNFDPDTLERLHQDNPHDGYDGLLPQARALPSLSRFDDLRASMADDKILLDCLDKVDRAIPGPFLDAASYAAIAPGKLSERPERPVQLAAGPGHWNPAATTRSLSVRATLPEGSLAALARRGGPWVSLGPVMAGGPYRALSTGDPVEDQVPGAPDRLRFFDPAAPDTARYRVAACNLLGQWSDWAEVAATPLPKPAPPPPQITLDVVYDLNNANRLGDLFITVEKPGAESIPPGGAPVQTLLLEVQDQSGAPWVALPAIDIADPFEAQTALPFPANNPETARVRGRFVDQNQTPSRYGTAQRGYVDPTPPDPVVIPPDVDFASRPDALGLSRYRLSWPAGAIRAPRYRIYYAEQGGLIGTLARDNATRPLATAIEAVEDLAQRALDIANARANLPKTAFEAIAETSDLSYEITVGGAIEGLGILRVVPVSAANVEGDFAASGLKPFAVPNADAPPMPQVRVMPVAGPVPRMAVEITVPPTHSPPAAVRLTRTQASSDIRALSEVTTLAGPPLQDDDGSLIYSYLDAGPLADAPGLSLAPFTAYSYAAEARFGPRANGGPDGDWSDPSPRAGSIWVPDGPPPAVENLSAVLSGGVTLLGFDWPGDPDGGTLGSYVFDLFGPDAGGQETLLTSYDSSQMQAGRLVDKLTTLSLGARLRVLVTDPAGRRSAMTATLVEAAP